MNIKNFIIGGIVGGIATNLAGWLFYGVLFVNQFPQGEEMDMKMVLLGCMTYGFLLSYIFTKWANIKTAMSGLGAGAVLGLIIGIWSNFFQAAASGFNAGLFALDVGVSVGMGAIAGLAIGFVLSKMK